MIKLATPISDLFKDKCAAAKIAELSFCLECRKKSMRQKWPKQYLFHLDMDVLHPWSNKDKDLLNRILREKKELKLITFHIASSCSKPEEKNGVFHVSGKNSSRQAMLDSAFCNIKWLKRYTAPKGIKIAVENNNYYPNEAYRYITDADFIKEIVERNSIFFVFDLAHAKITSRNKKISYKKYIAGLPMKYTIQAHVSKEAAKYKNLAYDAHNAPDRLSFEQVKSATKKFPPEYLTVEYYKDKDALIRILKEYKNLCKK